MERARIPPADNLTPRAHRLLADAAELAAASGSPCTACEHILIALIRMSHGVAGRALEECGVTEELVLHILTGGSVKPKPQPGDIPPPLLTLPLKTEN